MKNIYISSCDKNGGIYHYRLENNRLRFVDKTNIDRPMYSVYKDGKLWVLLREINEDNRFGGIMSFDVSADGKLCNPSDVKTTNGICPCHLCATEDDVYFVNYLSGNIATLRGKVHNHTGKGINIPRQDSPHTHYVNISPDGKYLLSCDLGIDTVYTYNFDLTVKSAARVPIGHGARHLEYSECGKYVYCANELMSTVSVFSYNDGILGYINTYSCTQDTTKESYVAAIRRKGNYLYISNRGEDTIVCFEIKGEQLELKSRTKVGGEYPRDFDIADNILISTNEHTDNITVFTVKNEMLTQIDNIDFIKAPICVTIV